MCQHLQGEDPSGSPPRGHWGTHHRWRQLPYSPWAWYGATGSPGPPRGRGAHTGLQPDEGAEVGEAVRQPGGVGLVSSRASPSLVRPPVFGSIRYFPGERTDSEAERTDGQGGRAERARSRGLALAEPQLPGWAGAPRGSGCRACSPNAPAPGPPSRHVLRIPRERPALAPPGEARHAALASPPLEPSSCHDTPPAAAAKPPAAFAKEKPRRAKGNGSCRGARRARGLGGGALPRDPSPAAACVSSRVESPAPAVRGLLAFFLQKRLKMPASRPSATGPTWRAPSS